MRCSFRWVWSQGGKATSALDILDIREIHKQTAIIAVVGMDDWR
jgi:hypothetical protein